MASDKTQLKRFVSSKHNLLSKIQQLECPIGCYVNKQGDAITDDGLVLYITLNPRDMRKASFASIAGLAGMLSKHDEGDLNPHSEVLSQIHKAKSRSVFVHFDIDVVTGEASDANSTKSTLSVDEIYLKACRIVGKDAVTIIQTRGGCHVLVYPEKVFSLTKNWHPILVRELKCDQVGDLMVPVVGCCQGGFVPHFYDATTLQSKNCDVE
jgi:hypothetical protein